MIDHIDNLLVTLLIDLGCTNLLLTTDHGRGIEDAWRDHGRAFNGSEHTWLALIGPNTTARGIW